LFSSSYLPSFGPPEKAFYLIEKKVTLIHDSELSPGDV